MTKPCRRKCNPYVPGPDPLKLSISPRNHLHISSLQREALPSIGTLAMLGGNDHQISSSGNVAADFITNEATGCVGGVVLQTGEIQIN